MTEPIDSSRIPLELKIIQDQVKDLLKKRERIFSHVILQSSIDPVTNELLDEPNIIGIDPEGLDIFSDQGRNRFLMLIQETVAKFGADIYAFVMEARLELHAFNESTLSISGEPEEAFPVIYILFETREKRIWSYARIHTKSCDGSRVAGKFVNYDYSNMQDTDSPDAIYQLSFSKVLFFSKKEKQDIVDKLVKEGIIPQPGKEEDPGDILERYESSISNNICSDTMKLMGIEKFRQN